jgi:predicted permease
MAQKDNIKKLIIPYFAALGFVAISINSIAHGIDNRETWRIITASIGGTFFLGIAILMIVRLIKTSRKNKPRLQTAAQNTSKLRQRLKQLLTVQGTRRLRR